MLGIHCRGLDFLSVAIEMSTYGFSSGSASFNLLFQRGIFINVSPHFTFLGTWRAPYWQVKVKEKFRFFLSVTYFEGLVAENANTRSQ